MATEWEEEELGDLEWAIRVKLTKFLCRKAIDAFKNIFVLFYFFKGIFSAGVTLRIFMYVEWGKKVCKGSFSGGKLWTTEVGNEGRRFHTYRGGYAFSHILS